MKRPPWRQVIGRVSSVGGRKPEPSRPPGHMRLTSYSRPVPTPWTCVYTRSGWSAHVPASPPRVCTPPSFRMGLWSRSQRLRATAAPGWCRMASSGAGHSPAIAWPCPLRQCRKQSLLPHQRLWRHWRRAIVHTFTHRRETVAWNTPCMLRPCPPPPWHNHAARSPHGPGTHAEDDDGGMLVSHDRSAAWLAARPSPGMRRLDRRLRMG
jgi:hypothetical protein